MAPWLELSVEAPPEVAEAVHALFARFNDTGAVIEQYPASGDEDATPILDLTQPVWVKTYLPVDHRTEERRAQIQRGLLLLSLVHPLPPLRERQITETDWQEAWKPFFPVLHLGRRLVIKPSWQSYEPLPGELLLHMDPGMAFGTGLHPSTQLCLEELEDWVKLGDHVLDLGTGSGILALATARLGAQRVIAVDTDPEAVAVARRNVQANALEQHILVAEGSLPWATGLIETSFDLVAANLTATGIARMAPLLWDAVKDGGTVIAGGIVGERKAQTEEALRKAGFALVKERSKGDWYVLVAQRSRL